MAGKAKGGAESGPESLPSARVAPTHFTSLQQQRAGLRRGRRAPPFLLSHTVAMRAPDLALLKPTVLEAESEAPRCLTSDCLSLCTFHPFTKPHFLGKRLPVYLCLSECGRLGNAADPENPLPSPERGSTRPPTVHDGQCHLVAASDPGAGVEEAEGVRREGEVQNGSVCN